MFGKLFSTLLVRRGKKWDVVCRLLQQHVYLDSGPKSYWLMKFHRPLRGESGRVGVPAWTCVSAPGVRHTIQLTCIHESVSGCLGENPSWLRLYRCYTRIPATLTDSMWKMQKCWKKEKKEKRLVCLLSCLCVVWCDLCDGRVHTAAQDQTRLVYDLVSMLCLVFRNVYPTWYKMQSSQILGEVINLLSQWGKTSNPGGGDFRYPPQIFSRAHTSLQSYFLKKTLKTIPHIWNFPFSHLQNQRLKNTWSPFQCQLLGRNKSNVSLTTDSTVYLSARRGDTGVEFDGCARTVKWGGVL